MKILFAVVLGCFLVSIAEAKASSSAAVRCVQNQLNALGYDAGSPDGRIGPNTKRALKAFSSKTGFSAKFPFHAESANSYCRRIGLQTRLGRKYWPSNGGALQFSFEPGMRLDLVRQIKTYARKYHASAAARLGVDLAGTDTMVFARSPRALKPMVRQHFSHSIKNFDRGLQEICDPRRKVSASALPRLVYMCVTFKKGEQIDSELLHYILAHEAVHLIQSQVAGSAGAVRSYSAAVKREGPLWLSEGIAEVMAFQLVTRRPLNVLRQHSLSHYNSRPVQSLKRLEKPGSTSRNMSDVYNLGTLAVIDLVEARGIKSVRRYFEALGEGHSWPTAFKHAFGVSKDQFYKNFMARYAGKSAQRRVSG